MEYKYDEAVIDVTLLCPAKEFGYVFGFEVKPTDGSPYRAGYLVANDRDTAAEVIYSAYKIHNLDHYCKNAYGL